MIDISPTLGETKNRLQRNKLKGTAQEKILSTSIGHKNPDKSLQLIIKKYLDDNPNLRLFQINVYFEINSKEYKKNMVFYDDEFNFGKINSFEKVLFKGLKRCKNTKCEYHIQKMFRDKRRVCPKCDQKLEVWSTKLNKKENIFESFSKEETIKFLNDEGYIDNRTELLNRRVDDILLIDNKMVILESKNNEKTQLTKNSVRNVIIYPKLLRRKKNLNIDLENLWIIYNGQLEEEIELYIEDIRNTEKINVTLIPLSLWCAEHKTKDGYISSCLISWNKEKGYSYEINYSNNIGSISTNIISCNPDCKDNEDIKSIETKDDRNDVATQLEESNDTTN